MNRSLYTFNFSLELQSKIQSDRTAHNDSPLLWDFILYVKHKLNTHKAYIFKKVSQEFRLRMWRKLCLQ